MKESENDYIKELRSFKKLLIFLTVVIVVVLVSVSIYLANILNSRLATTGANTEKSNVVEGKPLLNPTPSIAPVAESQYAVHKDIYATMFWVGEDATEANDYIDNYSSAWDIDWQENFGGVDDPYNRDGYYPREFVPRENPFYVALPYFDFDGGVLKESAESIPWFEDGVGERVSILKNRWVRVSRNGVNCYAQWEDVGPFETDDFEYVFGDAHPAKSVGIDLSPAVFSCLGMKTNGLVEWQFVDAANIPHGPWTEIITTSQINW